MKGRAVWNLNFFREDGPETIGQSTRLPFAGVSAEDSELLSAVTRDHVFGAQATRQTMPDFAERQVSHLVTAFVVDLLEVIDIAQYERERRSVAIGERELGA